MTIISKLTTWARTIKRDVVALWIAARDPRVHWFSPIDLIPDFVPVRGLLDDIIIVPLGIMLAIKIIPVPLMDEFRTEATRREDRPKSYAGLSIIVAIWIACAAWLV
jgi:uncharacterized membrane protein YkvA (DUF1232 family)